MKFFQQFGGKINSIRKESYARSPQWDGEKFVNLEDTSMDISFSNFPSLLKKQFTNRLGRAPQQPLPIIPFDITAFEAPSPVTKFIWFGHSVLLLRINNKTILIDPMFGDDTTPIAPFASKRFSKHTLDIIDALPQIDLLLLSHDHYDHLDLASMRKLAQKTSLFFVALGTARHLHAWGISSKKIREFDWWDQQTFAGIQIHFTPTRHFSGRGLTDRFKSLWGGWVLLTGQERIYFSGDSGYGNHFKTVGAKLGPFDFGFMECGQYNEHWHQIHMYPEEAVQAAIDARVAVAMPVHWAAFTLSLHHWKDPIQRFSAAAIKQNLAIATPRLGELVTLQPPFNIEQWWQEYE